MNGKGNVVVFTIPEQANLKERLRGYRDALEATPGIKITRVVDMKGDSRVAFDTATEILGNDKKEHVDAFVCLEALAGKEVATVLSQHDVKDKVIVAMDTDDNTLEWIQKGVIAATISQKPYTMSFVGLKMLDDLYHHKLSTLTNDWAKDSFCADSGVCGYGIGAGRQNQRRCPDCGQQIRDQHSEISCNYEQRDSECESCCWFVFMFSQLTGPWTANPTPISGCAVNRWRARPVAASSFFSLRMKRKGPNDLYGYRPDDNFFYLSGWSEPGAALLIVGAPDSGSANSQDHLLYRDLVSSQSQSIAGEVDWAEARRG